ncbi:MAG: flagellar cap protein FliD N-terminal domain-containing protein, partial [Candidatus Margulisbacteria bacterium]|nr:flagellar cap protein FliD N-terminal domain-containing protein [Candidatus Margulisiibacteriota bacterium]
MANISGMSSGLDTESIINSLMAIKRQQVTNLTQKRDKAQAKESTWGSISADLVSLQVSNYTLSRTATFGAKSAVSSNEGILSISASVSANAGSYSFYVNQQIGRAS